MRMESRTFDTLDSFKMQRLFIDENINEDFYYFESVFNLYSKYYNKNNFVEEPFIESIPLDIKM